MPSSFGFPKSVRLLTSAEYSDIFQAVDIRASSKHFLVLARNSTLPEARLGIIVAKKNVKHAVQRNRIKRLVRESFRLRRSSHPHLDIIILAKKGADQMASQIVTEELHYLWDKLNRKATVVK